jgi:hypothetical protein
MPSFSIVKYLYVNEYFSTGIISSFVYLALDADPRFVKLRSSLERKLLHAFSAFGTSTCIFVAGAFRPYGSQEALTW